MKWKLLTGEFETKTFEFIFKHQTYLFREGDVKRKDRIDKDGNYRQTDIKKCL